jgi:hypothetical protein
MGRSRRTTRGGWRAGRCRRVLRRVLRPAFLVPLLLALGSGSLLSTAPAAAAGNGRFSIGPASSATTQRTYFTPVLSPGVTSSDSVVVINETTQPLTLDLYAADALTTRSGQFALQPNFKPKRAMGAWIHLPVSKVTVPARSGDIVPFTYHPPANVPPGDYAGGIVAEETAGTVTKRGALRVQALDAVGTAVYGRVSGPLRPRLVVTAVSLTTTSPFAAQFGGAVDATVTYSITNTGNEDLKPQVTVSLSPLLGGGPGTARITFPQVLPGSTVTFSRTFDGVVPFGHLTAAVSAHALGAQGSGSVGAVVIPWGLVAVVVLLLLLVTHRRRRRRRRGRPGKPRDVPAGPGPDDAEVATTGSAGSGARGP